MADLVKFFIFNISRGQIEGHERDKILYHWNRDAPNCRADLKTQIQDICLCDASINFCKQFDPSGTQQQMMIFSNSKLIMIEVERDHWFGVSVSRLPAKESASVVAGHSNSSSISTLLASSSSAKLQPSTTQQQQQHQQQKLTQSAETRTFDINQYTDEFPRSVSASSLANNNQQNDSLSATIDASCATSKTYDPDRLMSDQQTIASDDSIVPNGIVEQLLTNIYKRFCLLNGTFQMLNDSVNYKDHEDSHSMDNDEPLKKLRSICAKYFDQLIPAIKLYTMVANINLLYMHIQYLSLDCISLMKVNSFVNQILCLNSSVLTHSMVVFNNQLIWSTLTLDDTRILYHYLISTVIREALDEELSGDIEKVRKIRNEQKIYLSNNSVQNNNNQSTTKDESANSRYHPLSLIMHYMTIFRSSNDMTLCLIHNKSDMDLMDKCERFLLGDPRIGIIPLASLAQMVGQIFVKMNTRSGQGRSLSNFSGNSSSNLLNGGRGHINLADNDKKYAFLDHSNASYKSPIGQDIRKTMDGDSIMKNLKFSKHVLELEMDATLLEASCDSFVQEILGRTTSDNWLTASRTRSRKLYSIHHNRNASLVEAYQSATNMRKQFSDILF